jgi:hypothetical protein
MEVNIGMWVCENGNWNSFNSCHPATRWFLVLLIPHPEDGVDTLLRNVGLHTDYTALYPRRWQHSCTQMPCTEGSHCVTFTANEFLFGVLVFSLTWSSRAWITHRRSNSY